MNSTGRKMQIAIGVLPWVAMLFFIVTPFLRPSDQTGGFILACIIAALFLVTAPFVPLSDDAAFHRLCGLLIFGLGITLLATAIFTDSESIVATLCGPASIVFIGLGVVVWSHAILVHCFQRDRSKSIVTLVSAVLALLIMTLGPILIGLPLLHMIGP